MNTPSNTSVFISYARKDGSDLAGWRSPAILVRLNDVDRRAGSLCASRPGTGGTLHFTYDPFGRRIEKISPTAGTTIYTYDGNNEVSQLTATGGLQVRFTQGLGIDEPLVEQRPARTVFTEADALGTVTSHTDPNGNLVDTFTFDSFGWVDAGFDPATDWYLYTGREIDTETALYYYRARYYDPQAGRFLGEDPIGFRAGINFYRYVHNLPTTSRDPSGYEDCDAVLPANPDAALLAHLIAGEATWRENNTSEMAAVAYTVVNRLDYLQANPKVKPSFFGGTSASISGLITPGQYGSIGSPMWNLTDKVSTIDTSCARGKALCDFFKNAFAVADGVLSGDTADPFADNGGAFAMRTAGHGSPGGLFTNIPPDAQIKGSNNVFFGLSR
ncbi:MAG TPA: RHS repeat-associated core domain-containing protein [Terriglobia bacterium]|nr:RHS repeat-associated core domain-containing protein [Terriglobia bacterium]